MSSITDRSGHIAWLTARLANTRSHLLGLLQRLTGLGSSGSLQPALFAKFSHWLEEVATAKDEEMGLMTRIEDIEREHSFMRVSHKLKHAEPKHQLTADHVYCNDNVKRPTRSLMWLLMFWYLFMRQKINQKKQGLTAD